MERLYHAMAGPGIQLWGSRCAHQPGSQILTYSGSCDGGGVMWIVGGILIMVGIVLYFVHRRHTGRLGHMKRLRTSTVKSLQETAQAVAQEIGAGSWGEYVEVKGKIQCDRPLSSELSQTPCVYYETKVVREYEETYTDSDGHRRTRRSSDTVSSNNQSIPFWIEDSTGRIEIEPEGADIDAIQTMNEFRPQGGGGSQVSFGNFSFSFDVHIGSGGRTLGYRFVERLLPLDRRAYVLARVSDHSGRLALVKPTESGQVFLISLKSEEQLTTSSQKTADLTFYGMFASLGIGLVLVIADLIS